MFLNCKKKIANTQTRSLIIWNYIIFELICMLLLWKAYDFGPIFFKCTFPHFKEFWIRPWLYFMLQNCFAKNNYTITKIHINCNLQTKIYKYVKIVMKTDRWILKTCPSARVDTIYKFITLNFSNRAINLYFIRFLFLCLFCHFDRSWRLQHPLYQNMAVNNWQVTNVHV